LGLLTGDDRERVLANRERLAGALGFEAEKVLIGLQVHGGEVATHSGPIRSGFVRPLPNPPAVDGHATDEPGVAPLVIVADCLPVALAGPGGVAMLHCGWRGLAAGIVARGVAAVGATIAAIGPGIGPCCYEIGPEVLEAFADLKGVSKIGSEPGRAMLDLPEVARRLLAIAGVERVISTDLCTSCEPELFFSYRRDGERTGRQAGVAWLPA
jgi:YfiH family protein